MADLAADLAWLYEHAHIVHVTLNEHRTGYETVESEIRPDKGYGVSYDLDRWGSAETRDAAVAANRLVSVQVYPDTPVGSYVFHGVDLAETVARARRALEADRG